MGKDYIRLYRTKPVVKAAIQYNGANHEDIREFVGHKLSSFNKRETLHISTLEGMMLVNRGDYVIKGLKGEFYSCKQDIFEMTYELEEGQHAEATSGIM